MEKNIEKFISICLLLSFWVSASCLTALAKETTSIYWHPNGYYAKECFEDANRSDFVGSALAARNSQNRDSATKRAAGAFIYTSYERARVTLSVKDWVSGASILEVSDSAGFDRFFNYSSPISVFACIETWLTNGDYVCVYPTSIGW